jgi:hypothetical protein
MPDQPAPIRLRRRSVVFPILLIGFGGLMLLWRWLPGLYPWPVLWKYWPLILVCIGAGMLWDRAQRPEGATEARPFPIGSTLGAVAFVLIMGLLIARSYHRNEHDFSQYSSARLQTSKTIEKGAAKAVKMNLQMSAGELHLEGGSDHLLQAGFNYDGAWNPPDIEYSVNGSEGELTIGQQSQNQFAFRTDNTWNLKVSDSIPLSLKIDIGAGHGDLRLAKVDLTELELNIGAGQANVDLTGERAKDLKATIHGGVGEAIVRLPKNIGVIAEVHGGLGSIDVHGLTKEEDQYVNAAYGKSPNTIHLTVEGGIGHIELQLE